MPIASTDIQYRLSGGASNTSQNASLGGAKSSTAASAAIFDAVSGDESAAGDAECRCVYVHNAHATLTLTNAVAWLQSNTPSSSTQVDIGLGTSAVNGTEQLIANENTAPTGVAFVAGADKAGGVALGDIPPGQHRAVWLRRTVNGGAAAANDSFTVRAEGETGP